ncbi:hypothetical protein T459_04991 [Capsicum annuum]|uniref:Uncharacterized protein n=1 Tax=Capsicum annuum TaxID=4072 RepID=A0A2G3A6N9_CAPAN|nr:hypothetical protein T459_04991 [Capsicum annuum]
MGSTRRQPRSQSSESNTHSDSSDDKFGFQSGSEFTFEEFEAFAKEFKELYFGTNDNEVWRPSIEEIEGEYWRIIEKPTDEVEVYYGADLETGVFGSGFPLESSSPKASTSSPKTGVYWNVLLIILLVLEDVMRKHLPDLFEEQPDLLHELSAAKSYSSRQSMPQWDVLSSQNGRHKFDYVDIFEI